MTDDLLERLDKLAAKSPGGEWYVSGTGYVCARGSGIVISSDAVLPQDAAFIVSLVNAYPALAARLRAAEKVCEAASKSWEHKSGCNAYFNDECDCGFWQMRDALEAWRRARSGSETP